ETLAAFVEDNYPGEGGEPFQQVLVGWDFPSEFEMRERPRDQHDIARAVPKNPVSDVNVAALCVLRRGLQRLPPIYWVLRSSRPRACASTCSRSQSIGWYSPRLHCEIMSKWRRDRKSTRLNSSHGSISYAVFFLTKNN